MCVTPEIIVQIKQTFEIDGKPVAALPPIPKSFDDSLLSTYDAAERLAISPETLRRMCRRKAITFIQVGSEYRFSQWDIEEYVASRRNRRKSSVR